MHIRGLSCSIKRYRQRRNALIKRLSSLPEGPTPLLLGGVQHSDPSLHWQAQVGRQRQDPWFDWSCGCHESHAALLIEVLPKRRVTLFLDPGDPARVVWDGAMLAPSPAARRAFGVDRCLPIADLQSCVKAAAEAHQHRIGLCWREREPGYQTNFANQWKRKLRGVAKINCEPALTPLRMVKDAEELELHRSAVSKTAAGYRTVMNALPQAATEADIAGILSQHYLRDDYSPLAFSSIVGAGVNAATLHYPHNDQALPDVSCLVLIDSGASSGGYAADVTRTLPAMAVSMINDSASFTIGAQSSKVGDQHARPGITLAEWNHLAWQPILDAGFTRHHGLGHHLGLDVHDCADYERPLEVGNLITCEPGIYLPDEGIGIRIEDDLLITADGNINTTRMIPKT